MQKRFGTKDSVRCSEFRGGRFSEVANVLQVWDFQSVTRTLSAVGSVSASRSVRSGRFYCISLQVQSDEVICKPCKDDVTQVDEGKYDWQGQVLHTPVQ